MLNLLKHEIKSRRGAIIGWGIGLFLFGAMYIGIYPEFSEQMADLGDMSIYEAMAIDMTTFEGYAASVMIQYVPIILVIYAIIAGTGTLAGEEDSGTLELVLAMPLHRWQIVSMKAIALAVATFLMVVIAAIGYAVGLAMIEGQIETDVTTVDMFIATLSGWPITFTFMMIGLFLGTYLPNRRTAALATTVIFIASYFGTLLAGMVDSLASLAPVSPFHYFDVTPALFTEGIQASDVLTLLLVAVIFFGLAVISFQRRNITVGAWPWQRATVN
jgi:ABC-2 type transport system permease protein